MPPYTFDGGDGNFNIYCIPYRLPQLEKNKAEVISAKLSFSAVCHGSCCCKPKTA